MASINRLTILSGAASRFARIPPPPPDISPLRLFSISAILLGPKAKPAAAAPAVAKATTKLEKKIFPIETDTEKLAKYCCINYAADKTGGPGPEIRDDDHYPDWLWELNKAPRPYFELDTKTPEYWHRRKRSYQYYKAQMLRKKPYGIV